MARVDKCEGANRRCGDSYARRAGASLNGIPTTDTSPGARHTQARRTRLAYGFQPGGLRAGSPPSPPPHSIRPTVRRLLWSPRLMGPGPRGRVPSGSGGRRLLFDDLQQLRKYVLVVLLQVTSDLGVADETSEVALREH